MKTQILVATFLAIVLVSCTSKATVPQTETPEQEAIDAMILGFTGDGNIAKWDKLKTTDFVVLPLSDADQANGIQQRVCITLSYIEKNDQGEWQDKSISYSMEKKQGIWQPDKNLMESKNYEDPFANVLRIVSGNCNFARTIMAFQSRHLT